MLEARVVIDRSIVKATYSPGFLLNAYKQKHNTSHEGTAALELHIYHDNFGATPRYKGEKPKTLSAKRGRQAFIVNGYLLLSKSLPGFKITL